MYLQNQWLDQSLRFGKTWSDNSPMSAHCVVHKVEGRESFLDTFTFPQFKIRNLNIVDSNYDNSEYNLWMTCDCSSWQGQLVI